MAADVKFCFKDPNTTGAGSFDTLTGTLRFKALDNNTGAATDNPLVRPSSGTYYSYWKNLRCRVVDNPAVALLSLRVKSSVAAPGPVTGLVLAYTFRVSTNTDANSNVVLPSRIGALGTSEVAWLNGGSGGSAVPNHVEGTAGHVDGAFWAAASSDQLVLSMEVGVGNGSGGAITPFNLILVYNEI